MAEPLFPIRPQPGQMTHGVLVIEPYRHQGTWVFDDPATGLVREPFVAGITEMIDRLTAGIPDAASGFRLLFAISPFQGHQTSLTWIRSDPVEGNWYRADDIGDEGWLCPALFCYYPVPADERSGQGSRLMPGLRRLSPGHPFGRYGSGGDGQLLQQF